MIKLDLHGVKHAEVKSLLDSFLWDNMQKNKKEIQIITGSSDQMKRIVRNLVDEYSMNCYEDPKNNGLLIIELV
jgi:DNA-nicking Smr family endonuclease